MLRPEGRKQTCLGHQTAGFTPHTRKTIARCTTDPRQKCAHPPNPSKHHSPPQGGDAKGEQSDLAEAADRKKANLMHWPDHHQQFQPPKDITHIHTCARAHTHTYIPMRTHTHTHTHTHTLTELLNNSMVFWYELGERSKMLLEFKMFVVGRSSQSPSCRS